MARRSSALGKGLGALIDDQKYELKTSPRSGVSEVSIADIETNPFQPRTEFDEEKIEELSRSIEELGIIQPITLRRLRKDLYQLVSGERRLRAAKKAGLEEIPAYIREVDDQEMLEMALVENIQREELNSIEIAISYQRLIEECQLTQERMSERVGKKRSTITNYLRLLKLPAEIQIGLRDRTISMGHARALINIEDKQVQIELYHKVVREELSVRKTEDLVRQLSKNTPSQLKEKIVLPSHYSHVVSSLKDNLKANISISRSKEGKGKIVIPFMSDQDFDRLTSLLNKIQE